jgi:hypothetical protein
MFDPQSHTKTPIRKSSFTKMLLLIQVSGHWLLVTGARLLSPGRWPMASGSWLFKTKNLMLVT